MIENIDSILEAVQRCGRITRQLLGFARKFDIKIQKIDVKDIVSDVLNFHNKEAAYRNIAVNVEVPEGPLEIESDRGKLQQILLNLVNNAFQAVAEVENPKVIVKTALIPPYQGGIQGGSKNKAPIQIINTKFYGRFMKPPTTRNCDIYI